MDREIGQSGRSPSGRATHERSQSSLSPPAVGVPNAAVAEIIADLGERFGPGFSNGVMAILLHPDPPKQFARKDWADWTFRPAQSAFELAHDRGLISPWKSSDKWTFTELGLAVREHVLAEANQVQA